MQGISGVAQVPLAHHAHEGDEDLEHALRRHLEFMVDPGLVAFSCKNESVASSQHLHVGYDTDLFVWPEFSDLLQHFAQSLDFKFELSALPSTARCEFSSVWRCRVPAREIGDIDYSAEDFADRSINNLCELLNGHVGL